MPAKHRQWDEKTYRATWEDVENWVQALYEDYGGQTEVSVVLPMPASGPRPCVRISVYRPEMKGQRRELWHAYQPVNLRAPHHAEHLALQMLSQAWLELERDRLAAEQAALLL